MAEDTINCTLNQLLPYKVVEACNNKRKAGIPGAQNSFNLFHLHSNHIFELFLQTAIAQHPLDKINKNMANRDMALLHPVSRT